MFIAKVIAFFISENTYNYIMRANFKRNFPKMTKLKIENLSSPKFFKLKIYNLVDNILRSILREFNV